MFERLEALINKDNLEKIKTKKILLVGCGGVGGFTLEALVRTGFLDITVVDGDIFEESNLNRQIIALTNNLGEKKVIEAQKRAKLINPKVKVTMVDKFLDESNFTNYLDDYYDYIIDACDEVKLKVALIKWAREKNMKIIVCLGVGKKIKAEKLKITTLNKTFNDALAKKLRSEVRKNNISLNIPVVFSEEEATGEKQKVASAIFTPAVAGIYLANYVFLDTIKEED